MRVPRSAIAAALGLALAPCVAGAATDRLAQAGSVGGSVGKQDKSLSGDAEEPRPARPGLSYPTGLDPRGDNWLALRSEPNGRGVRLKKMGPDTLMSVIGQDGAWLRVRLTTGETGWALGRYVACCR